MTYNGQINASFNFDAGLGVEPELLASLWNAEFELLHAEVTGATAEDLVPPPRRMAYYRTIALVVLALCFCVMVAVVLDAKIAVGTVVGTSLGLAVTFVARD
jgi:hypothetical protein